MTTAVRIKPTPADAVAMTVDQCGQSIPLFLAARPLSKVLTSMPGVGVRTGARILIEVGDGGTFPAGHPAPRAGLATATLSSGSSILASSPLRARPAHQS